MASRKTMAQDVILCHLCDRRAAQLHCNPCQVNLCEECVGKHFMTSSSATHEIVKYKERKFQLKFTNCDAHKTEKCTVFCRDCNLPVCIKCLTGVHKGHDVADFSEIIDTAKFQIDENTAILEDILPQFEQADRQVESKIADLFSRCDEMQTLAIEHGKKWHQVIDDIVQKDKDLISEMKESGLRDLRKCQAEIKDTIQVLMKAVQKNKKIIQSVDANEINQYELPSQNLYRDILLNVDIRLPIFVPKAPDTIQLHKLFGQLNGPVILPQISKRKASISNNRTLLDKAIEIKTFTIENMLRNLACLGTEEVWISYRLKPIIHRVNTKGDIQETVISSCLEWNCHPSNISISKNGELMYTDRISGSINIVRRGKSTTLFSVEKEWKPLGLCCTKSGELLVAMGTIDDKRYKVVRYRGRQVKQEIEKDDHGHFLFGVGDRMFYVTENFNGDICVSDNNSRAVVVINQSGKIRFRYKGIQEMEKEFIPCDIATDSMGRILVGDSGNKCIHITDQDGQFLHSISGYDMFSIDDLGRLWVGKYGGYKVKVISYTKQ
ncbi:uncharacterized protein LOC134276110 [Saccostrea cucullata]|uniref:uncharacterized protein LOC134276110 n=1 Tax=Saccostrea cuccullata TaxID=36930 RepID=UPI002ED44687